MYFFYRYYGVIVKVQKYIRLEMGDSRDHHVNRQHYLLTFAVIKRTHATNDMKCQRGRISL